jgi:methylated-DNA-[protein]-cysteine S-methyltransferase
MRRKPFVRVEVHPSLVKAGTRRREAYDAKRTRILDVIQLTGLLPCAYMNRLECNNQHNSSIGMYNKNIVQILNVFNHTLRNTRRSIMTKTQAKERVKDNDNDSTDLESLRSQWTQLYHSHLPSLAKSKDPSQPRWSVQLDHCFARIILDNVVGNGSQPWTEVLAKPAVKNMSADQLRGSIALAEKIAEGKADLVELDEESLKCRGKASKTAKRKRRDGEVTEGGTEGVEKKRRQSEDVDSEADVDKKVHEKTLPEQSLTAEQQKRPQRSTRNQTSKVSSYFQPLPSPSAHEKADRSDTKPSPNSDTLNSDQPAPLPSFLATRSTSDDIPAATFLPRIAADKTLTSFRKQTLSLLCSVPRGQWTTYGAMSKYINETRQRHIDKSQPATDRANSTIDGDEKSRVKHKPTTTNPTAVAQAVAKMTCARAVGNAMRNNPFAPGVPCHRVLAGDGSLGGFGGHWGEEGKFAGEKRRLLREEGVRFDGKGRAVGEPWKGWTESFAMV